MDLTSDPALRIDALCHEIVQRYHASLHRSIDRIQDAFSRLTPVSTPALEATRVAFAQLEELIESHLAKEEQLLFPALQALAAAEREGRGRPALPFSTLLHPIRMMEGEHVRIEVAVDHVREAARTVDEPVALLPQWRECLSELALLDSDLREHHRAENEALFPRALDLERRIL